MEGVGSQAAPAGTAIKALQDLQQRIEAKKVGLAGRCSTAYRFSLLLCCWASLAAFQVRLVQAWLCALATCSRHWRRRRPGWMLP